MTPTLADSLQKLTGQEIPLAENRNVLDTLHPNKPDLGYSQFNELLLMLGYDRVSQSFFQCLVDGTVDVTLESALPGCEQIAVNADKIIEISLRIFGNIKFGYKRLSSELYEDDFRNWIAILKTNKIDKFLYRHAPLIPIQKIKDNDTFFLGYLIQDEINRNLKNDPENETLKNLKEQMKAAILIGSENHKAYLASDYMDVYVATSMRLKHEYLFVSRITDAIFSSEELLPLNVRYFDPTQAYCSDRIDKGIAEALMLKRAKCTIYLAQETDTLGKDSELASTLAQGKTVVAYIPKGDKEYVDRLLRDLLASNPSRTKKEVILEQLQIFNSNLAWRDQQFRDWMVTAGDENYGLLKLYESVESIYDRRAHTLKETHPLGIQVNLDTGVANGVIVTRDIKECALLVRNVLLGQLDFKVVEEVRNGIPYVFLKEAITGSIHRLSSGDKLLSNTFWNYYLSKM